MFERRAVFHLADGTDREILGKDAVHAAGDDEVADFHGFVVANIFHVEQRFASSPDGALHPCAGNHGADAAIVIGQQKNLAGIAVGFDDFANDSFGRDNSHIFANAFVQSLIERADSAACVGAESDDASDDHGNLGLALLEVEQGREAISLGGFALQLHQFQLELAVFALKSFVLARGVAQCEVVTPGVAKFANAPGAAALERRNGGNRPDTDQPVVRIFFPLDLHGQQKNLQQHHTGEQEERAMSRGQSNHWKSVHLNISKNVLQQERLVKSGW